MTAESRTKVRKKKDVTVSMSPYLKAQLDKIVDSGDFSSVSDLITVASIEFITKYIAEKDGNPLKSKKADTKNYLDIEEEDETNTPINYDYKTD